MSQPSHLKSVPVSQAMSEQPLTSSMASEFLLEKWRVSERIFQFYPSLRRAREFVEKQYQEEIALAAVARVAGLEKKYFSAYFRAKAGVPFRHWLGSIRVREAIRMMSEQDAGLTYIACEVGFQDIRTFERTFKRLTGLTPRDIKRQLAPALPEPAQSSYAKGSVRESRDDGPR